MKTLIFMDLDDTLIQTKSEKTFPVDCSDWRLKQEVIDKLKEENKKVNLSLCIVSNQGGIQKGYFTREDFNKKIKEVVEAIRKETVIGSISYLYTDSNDPEDPMRKPNPGMYNMLTASMPEEFARSVSVMIGDASGKPGDFSDSDKKFAENAGIDYMDVNEFVEVGLSKLGN